MGHLRPRAGPCRRSEATESRCRMAAAHGAGRDPSACARGPESRSQPRTVHRLWRFVQAAAESKSGMDPRSESMGSEVWTRYGIGSMNQARSEARGGIDICELSAPGAHGITEPVSDISFSSIADENFRVGDLVLWRRPGKNPAEPSAGYTMRS